MSDARDVNAPNDFWNAEQTPFTGTASAGPASADPASATASGYTNSAGASSERSGPVRGGYATAPPPPPVVSSGGEPNPVLAAFLGLIPGVGAMYNGQLAKGIVHVVVFAVIVFFANNVSDIFGIFVAAWIFFMAFEAYHTAKARRDGLPLPNAFGWNDIGEHMGLGKNWPFSPASAPVAGSPAGTTAADSANPGGWAATPGYPGSSSASASAAGSTYSASTPSGAGSAEPPVPPTSPAGAAAYGAAPNWAGYVPPSAFASSAPAGATGGAVPPGQGVPYSPVSAGTPYAPALPVDGRLNSSRLPIGAMWLIGLGVLFLLGQWTPLLQVSRVWIPSVLLIGVAALLFARRMGWTGASNVWQRTAGLPVGLRAATAVRVPGILVAIAVLNGLHEAGVVRWDHSWPWLLICTGVLLLVERLAMRQANTLQLLNGQIPASSAPNGGL